MADIRGESPDSNGKSATISLKKRIEDLEEKVEIKDKAEETNKKKKFWEFPGKWKRGMNKSTGKLSKDKILVLYLNIKGEIEPPIIVPLYSGNIIIYRNKAYEFDPRALWTIQNRKKTIKVVLLREMDRRPVSNLDWDEVKKRGDSTDSDEILIKMVKKALIEKQKKNINKGMIILVVLAIIGVIIFLMLRKG